MTAPRAAARRSAAAPRPASHSAASVDALVCPRLVDAGELSANLLTEQGLVLQALPGVPRGQHPLVIEVWRVHDGRMQLAGVDAHTWWERVGAALGGSVGASVGVGVGAGFALGLAASLAPRARGAEVAAATRHRSGGPVAKPGRLQRTASGIHRSALAGARLGAGWLGTVGRWTSEGASRTFGTYDEVMVTIPGVRTAGNRRQPFAWVASMYTNSLLSRWGEQLLGFGYGKQPARIEAVLEARVRIRAGRGQSLAALDVAVAVDPAAKPLRPELAAGVFRAWRWPLLGRLPSGGAVESFLDRLVDARSVQLTPVAVHLATGEAFVRGMPAYASDVPPLSKRHPWGALLVRGLPVRLSQPRPVSW